jgi:hypothetical protein
MTALNIVRQTDAVHLITDGAAINADGKLHSVVSKVTILPHINTVVAANGMQVFRQIVSGAFENALSYDDLRETAVDRIRAVIAPIEEILKSKLGPNVFEGTVAVAGWS